TEVVYVQLEQVGDNRLLLGCGSNKFGMRRIWSLQSNSPPFRRRKSRESSRARKAAQPAFSYPCSALLSLTPFLHRNRSCHERYSRAHSEACIVGVCSPEDRMGISIPWKQLGAICFLCAGTALGAAQSTGGTDITFSVNGGIGFVLNKGIAAADF